VKHPILLFGFLTALGAALMIVSATPGWSLSDWFDLLAYVHSKQLLDNISTNMRIALFCGGIASFAVGIVGLEMHPSKSNRDNSIFLSSITASGLIFATLFFFPFLALALWNVAPLLVGFIWFCLPAGTILATAGISGIIKQSAKNSPNPFTRKRANSLATLAAILVPAAIFTLFLRIWLGALTVGF